MKTQDTDNHNGDISTTLHAHDVSAPSISPDLLAESIYSMIRYKMLPKGAIDMLTNESMEENEAATFCLLSNELSSQLSVDEISQVIRNMNVLVKGKSPFALYVKGCSLLLSGSCQKIVKGVELLNKAAEDGISEAYWVLALHYARQDGPEALKYGSLASASGWPPATQADEYAQFLCKSMERMISKSHKASLASLRTVNSELELHVETLKTKFRAEKADLNTQVMNLQKRCEGAESRLASWSAEALKDEHILKLQSSTKKAEEDWLEAKCAQEAAEASKLKAERLADDLTRQNKYYISLLRTNGIPFTESSSISSPEDGEPHLGLAS